MTRRLALLVAFVVALAACARDRTLIIVVVGSDYPVPSAIDTISVRVGAAPDTTTDAAFVASHELHVTASDAGIPSGGYTLAIEPSGAHDATIEIVVAGSLGGQEIVEQTVVASFRPNETRVVNVHLTRLCDGVACPSTYTCRDVDGGAACATPMIDTSSAPTMPGCEPGRARCSSSDSPLCETDVDHDAQNCGACGHACDAGDTCVGGVCQADRFVQVVATATETCARRASNRVICWGRTLATSAMLPPHAIVGDPNDVIDLAAGDAHICALRRGGQVLCWGDNTWGQLGDQTTTASETPVVVTSGTAFAHIGAGGGHTCAIHQGNVTCWGRNDHGQCGQTASPPIMVPTAVSTQRVTDIVAGESFTCALADQSNGFTVYCWGDNSVGQLGVPTTGTPESSTPVEVSAGSEQPHGGSVRDVAQFAAGARHVCIVYRTTQYGTVIDPYGHASCWGDNSNGQLGRATGGTYETSPMTVEVVTENVASIGAFGDTSCAIGSDSHALYCWGVVPGGVAGTPTSQVPVLVPWFTGSVAAFGGGASSDPLSRTHACAAQAFGSAFCWGSNVDGELGADTGGIAPSFPISPAWVP